MNNWVRFNDPSKGEVELVEIEGVEFVKDFMELLVPGKTVHQHVEEIKSLELLDDDIIICAYPKCGTHWVWEILQELLSSESSSDKGRKLSTMLDFQAIEKIISLPSPRILNTHFPPQLLPQAIKEKKTRLVYLYRNPKDVAISAYYFFSKVFEMINANVGELENFKRHLLTEKVQVNIFEYMRQFKKFLEENPDISSIVLSYEDLTEDPCGQIRRLAEFVGVKCSQEQIAHIADACSFDNMKKAITTGRKKDNPSVYRKGKVGDWKNYFTVAESEMYDKAIEKELGESGILFKFE